MSSNEKEKQPERTLTRVKKLMEKISTYHFKILDFKRDRLLVEIATNLFAIFLQLKELEDSINSIPIPEDKP